MGLVDTQFNITTGDSNICCKGDDFSELVFWQNNASKIGMETSPTVTSNNHCELCGKWFAQLESLRKHKQAYCGKEARFTCLYCPYKSIMKGNLKRHMSSNTLTNLCPRKSSVKNEPEILN